MALIRQEIVLIPNCITGTLFSGKFLIFSRGSSVYNSLDAGALSVEVWMDLGPNVRIQVGFGQGRPKETLYGSVVDPDPHNFAGSGCVRYRIYFNQMKR